MLIYSKCVYMDFSSFKLDWGRRANGSSLTASGVTVLCY